MSETYTNNQEHLSAELALLDRRLRTLLPATPENPPQPYSGLVMTREQVLNSLQAEPDFSTQPEPAQEPGNRINEDLSASQPELRLPRLAESFQLSGFEQACLLSALASELDSKYQRAYGYLQDDCTQRFPSIELLLRLYRPAFAERGEALSVFAETGRLRRFKLVEVLDPDGVTPLIGRQIRLDERIASFLMGSDRIDPILAGLAVVLGMPPSAPPAGLSEEVRSRLSRLIETHFLNEDAPGLVLHFYGRYGSGTRQLACWVSGEVGAPLLIVDLRELLESPLPFRELIQRVCREALLQPAAVCLTHLDCLLAEDRASTVRLKNLADSLRTFCRITFLLGRGNGGAVGRLCQEELFLEIECQVPPAPVRRVLWEESLNGHRSCFQTQELAELASKFRFTAGQVRDACAAARKLAEWEGGRLTLDQVYRACRANSRNLERLAQKIQPVYGWDDIVLPRDQKAELHELAGHVKHRQTVMDDWGFGGKFASLKGITALFGGSSGTGKTMAAEIIARELGLDLYKIDLSSVVSKYIGETEKNLNRIFEEAEGSGAILFFDEADALFGKRSEVKDAHDRYANIEVAYLLQKMEDYGGIVILATNLKKNLDVAFVRRMRFIVDFPFPDEEQREAIWRRIFPGQAPLSPDLDFPFLARALEITGGSIRNISLRASFVAASERRAISMQDVVQAAKRELQKMGRLYRDADLEFRPVGEPGIANEDRGEVRP